MKTTIEIADDLAARARAAALRDGETLRSLVEEGLRMALAAREASPRYKPFVLQTFAGKGVRAGVHAEFEGAGWERLRDAAYGADR